jgi:hypothetical protein
LNEADIIELWNERAAVREYDGGERRDLAELRAAMEVKKMIRPAKLPAVILEKIEAARI